MRKVRAFVIFVVLILGLAGVAAVVARSQAPVAQNPPPASSQTSSAEHGGELGFTDTPMLPGLPYHVHDPARPHPPVVTPGAQPGAAPADAILLFDGKDLSQWTYARRPAGGGAGRTTTDEARARMVKEPEARTPLGWKLENGYAEVIPRAGDMLTKEKFG